MLDTILLVLVLFSLWEIETQLAEIAKNQRL